MAADDRGAHRTRRRTRKRTRMQAPSDSFLHTLGRQLQVGVADIAVVAVMAPALIGTYVTYGATTEALRGSFALAVAFAAARTDLSARIIPNRLIVIGLVGGLGLVGFEGAQALRSGCTAAVAAFFLFSGIRWTSALVWGRPGMGMGDAKLAAVLGLLLGGGAFWGFYLAAVVGGLVGGAGMAAGFLRRDDPLPFAPFLALGVVLHLLVAPWDRVWTWLII